MRIIMSMETDHAWTREQMATALAGGLSGDDRARFDAHLAACATCAAEFAAMQRRDAALAALFADARPAAGFEDRLIRSLRDTKPPRTWVHPMVRRAAVGVAATLVLASAGYVVNSASNGGGLPDLVSIVDRARVGYAETQGVLPATQPAAPGAVNGYFFAAPSSNAEMDDYPAKRPLDRSNFTDLAKNQSYSYQHPNPPNNAIGSGLKLNNRFSTDFTVAADVNTGAGAGERRAGRNSDKPASGQPAALPQLSLGDQPAERGQTAAGKSAVVMSDGHAELLKNPFSRLQRDNIDALKRGRDGTTLRTTVTGSKDGHDSVLLPTDSFAQAEGKPASADAFKPAQLGFEPKENKGVVEELYGGLKVGDATRYARGTLGQQVQPPGQRPAIGAGGAPFGGARVVAGEPAQPAQQQQPLTQQAPQAGPSRKVIRSGAMEFEVDRFDAALAMITKLTQEAGGYVGTTDSEKLPNGKVKGTVIVRVPPERLDTLVTQLRGIGDLRSQKMDAQDVTKQYTDLEGELRAARAMEERLLEIIKTGKGEIKDLLAAEKELGVWRTKIEKMVGEMRYYDNLVALTTLTITAFERDIRTAAAAKETETVDAGIETDDVESARAAALTAIDEAKGRVIQSDLKRHDAGQFSAVVVAEVAPDAAGPLVDRLKQLGKVARFEVQRRQTTPEGTTQPAPGARLERAETRINLSLYNLANVAPRQTTNLNLAAGDVEGAYKAIAARVEKAGGRIVTSNLSRPKAEQVVGSIHFEVKAAEAEAVLNDVRGLGEVMRLTVTENPDTNNVTTAKQGFIVQLASVAAVPARESTNLQIAAADVPAAYTALREAVGATPARVTTAQLNEAVRENVTAQMDFEVMRADLPAVEAVLQKLGDVTQRTSGRSGDTENTVDSKVRMAVSFVDADQLPPRETTALGIETSDPDQALAEIQSLAIGVGGRVIQSNLSQERGGQTIAKLVVDVPLARSVELITRAKAQGSVRMVQSTKDAQVPDGSLARARVDMTYATGDAIVSADQGLWATIRRGLATSMTGLMWSLQLIVIGLCFVGPWVIVLALIWRFVRRRRTPPASAQAAMA